MTTPPVETSVEGQDLSPMPAPRNLHRTYVELAVKEGRMGYPVMERIKNLSSTPGLAKATNVILAQLLRDVAAGDETVGTLCRALPVELEGSRLKVLEDFIARALFSDHTLIMDQAVVPIWLNVNIVTIIAAAYPAASRSRSGEA